LCLLLQKDVAPVLAATCTWNGSSSTSFENPGNWSGCSGSIPSELDDVIIPDVTNDPVIAVARTLSTLDIQTGGSLSVNSGITLTVGTVDLTGTLTGSGDLAVSSQLHWHAGSTMSGAGVTHIQSGGTLLLNEAGGVDLTARTIKNDGTFTWTAVSSGSTIFADTGAAFIHNGSATFTAQIANLKWQDSFKNSTFTNNGSVNAYVRDYYGVVMETFFQNNGDLWVINNQSSEIASGVFRMSYGTTNSGSIYAPQPVQLAIGTSGSAGEEFTFTAESQLTAWNILFDAVGTVNFNGGVSIGDLNGSSQLSSNGSSLTPATINFNSTATIDMLGDKVTLVYTTLNLNNNGAVTIPTIEGTYGNITGNTDVSVSNLHRWTSGTISGSGDFTVLLDAEQRISSPLAKSLSGRTITNLGDINWQDGIITLSDDAVIDNRGTLDAQGDDTMSGGSAGSLLNSGLLLKSGGTGTTTIGVPFTNSGSIQQDSGQFSFLEDSLTIGAGESLELSGAPFNVGLLELSGGSLIGSGETAGDLLNGGTVSPGNSPGSITVGGNYTQTMSGNLLLELDRDQSDAFTVDGVANLGGTLTVTFLNSGDEGPPFGEFIPLLSYGSHTGTFAAVNLPEMAGKDWDLSYGSSGIALTVVDEAIGTVSAVNDGPMILGNMTTFTATISAGSNVTFTWDFGDDSPTKLGAVVTHTYEIAGDFTATVTVSNSRGVEQETTAVTIEEMFKCFLPVFVLNEP
jgi:hypothetical protein